jgi:hypothetical protein
MVRLAHHARNLQFNRRSKRFRSELGFKVVHRAVDQAGRASVLRQGSEAYGGEFASESNLLTWENRIRGNKDAETAET